MRDAPAEGPRVLSLRKNRVYYARPRCAVRELEKKTVGLTRFIRPSIAPTAVENQSQHVHSAKLWRKFCSYRGAQGHAPASRPAARPGGQEKSVAMSWFYMAMQREPVVMWSCFIGALGTHPRAFPSSQRRCPYAVQSARGFSPDRVALARFPRGATPGGPPGHLGTNASCARASVD
jgi:hypothetical protein